MTDNLVSKVRNAPEKYKHIIEAMEQEYIENGYLNCASMLVPTQFGKLCGGEWDETQRAIQELSAHGIIELRKCADYAVQLTVRKRYELIQKYDLARVWEQKAPYFYPNGEYGEVTCVLRDFELLCGACPSDSTHVCHCGLYFCDKHWSGHKHEPLLHQIKETTDHV